MVGQSLSTKPYILQKSYLSVFVRRQRNRRKSQATISDCACLPHVPLLHVQSEEKSAAFSAMSVGTAYGPPTTAKFIGQIWPLIAYIEQCYIGNISLPLPHLDIILMPPQYPILYMPFDNWMWTAMEGLVKSAATINAHSMSTMVFKDCNNFSH